MATIKVGDWVKFEYDINKGTKYVGRVVSVSEGFVGIGVGWARRLMIAVPRKRGPFFRHESECKKVRKPAKKKSKIV